MYNTAKITERKKMHRFAVVTQAHDEQPPALPFRRFDVVDETFAILLSGPSPDRLEPVSGRQLEASLVKEVRSLLHERRSDDSKISVGLIGLDHGVRVMEHAGVGPGYYLVCTERISLRGTFERLVARLHLDADETELARLLAGGYGAVPLALRLGTTPHDVGRRTERLLQKAMVRNRREFIALVFPRAAERRSKRRSHVRAQMHDASAS